MIISKKSLIGFLLLALISIKVWFLFSYPLISFVDLSINKNKSVELATQFIKSQGYSLNGFQSAVKFNSDNTSNRYLQKNLGPERMAQFVNDYDFDLFYWLIRFFKQGDQEEFQVAISSRTGKVIDYTHRIPDTEARPFKDKEHSLTKIKEFFKNQNIDLSQYSEESDSLKKKDNRTDYSFKFKHSDVNIPWSTEEDAGHGKLKLSATISGDEVLSFHRSIFFIPQKFYRHIKKLGEVGSNILSIIKILTMALFVATIYYIYSRRNHLAMQTTKRFYIGLMVISFLLSIAAFANNFQSLLFGFNTATDLSTHIYRNFVDTIILSLFVTIAIIMPALSGELLHYEQMREKPLGSFLYYVRSSFFTRSVAQSIALGYIISIILLGFQSLIFKFGQTYCGVWSELSMISSFSTSNWPFIAALTLGYKAAFSEELMYRMFALSWGKKIFKNTIAAVIIVSCIWGFAHSSYPVFPMWFRGIEVTLIGIFLSFIYLKYGIITVITAHFLFDVFWHSAGILFGGAETNFFFSTLLVILLPLIFAIICFFVNSKKDQEPLKWKLTKHQEFNIDVLMHYLKNHPELLSSKPKDELITEISKHGWDLAVVEEGIQRLENQRS